MLSSAFLWILVHRLLQLHFGLGRKMAGPIELQFLVNFLKAPEGDPYYGIEALYIVCIDRPGSLDLTMHISNLNRFGDWTLLYGVPSSILFQYSP